MDNSVEEAMKTLRKAMQEDMGYAWTWHCNVAVAMQDEGVSHEISNKGAARFMQWAFGIDTTKAPRPIESDSIIEV